MKRIIYLLLLFIITFSIYANAQDSLTSSKFGGNLGFNFSQVGLSNWTGGGNSMLAITGLLNLSYNSKTAISAWENTLGLAYGVTKIDKTELRKSDDIIILTSRFGFVATPQLNYSFLFDFRTQFYKGVNYDKMDSAGKYRKISNFLSPAIINVGLGMSYQPVDYLHLQFSPLANRLIIVIDEELSQQGAFGVDPGKNIKSELGASLNAFFKKDVFTNVNFMTRLNLFGAYHSMTSLVVTLETLLNMKVNDFMTASFATNLIYDEKIPVIRDNGTKGPATQFRNILSFGLNLKF
ncbi:MAG: DUF3078 domain-containing protein [Bacteroidota bacterium]